MSPEIKFLALLYAATTGFNLLLALYLWWNSRSRLHLKLAGVWVAFFLFFALSGLVAQSDVFTVVLTEGSSTVVVMVMISLLAHELLGEPMPWRRVGGFAAVTFGVGLPLLVLGAPFAVYSSVWILLEGLILFDVIAKGVRRWGDGSGAMRGFVISCALFLLNSYTYPFTRMDPSFAAQGFTIALVINFCLAIFAPMFIAEVTTRRLEGERNQAQARLLQAQQEINEQLEIRVAERTRELEAANQARERFFSIVAHDLRGPMGSLAMLFRDLVGDDGVLAPEVLSVVRTTTAQSHALLEDLLTWARSQRGELEIVPVSVELRPLIAQSIELLSAQAQGKGVALTLSGPEVRGLADPVVLATVLRNLIGNALKFTPGGGSVSVVIEAADPIRIRVDDTGVGIPEARRVRMFAADTAPTSTAGTAGETGTGLGLKLCQEYVRRSGGQIGVDARDEGGSSFWFTLPRALPEAAPQHLSQLRVLLVEDSPLHARTSGQVLRGLGISATLATSGAAARTLLGAERFDVVLLDIDLPDISGLEVLAGLRRQGGPQPGVFVLSSHSRADLPRLNSGDVQGWLSKPLQRERLLAALSGVAEESARERAV